MFPFPTLPPLPDAIHRVSTLLPTLPDAIHRVSTLLPTLQALPKGSISSNFLVIYAVIGDHCLKPM
ncbi:hypothetical protein BLD44_014655 [Mastigocladus laminosus UU774]|nr:hypothetical protein BLD44_014655 [Mastigocladus laminosus UU774]